MPVTAYHRLRLLGVLLILVGCARVPVVETWRDPQLTYDGYQTFALLPRADRTGVHPLEEKELLFLARTELERRGLHAVERDENPGLLLSLEYSIAENPVYIPPSLHTSPIPWGPSPWWHWSAAYGGYYRPYVAGDVWIEGGYSVDAWRPRIRIDLLDAAGEDRPIVWSGTASIRTDQPVLQRVAPLLIRRILERFPPEANREPPP